jgi:hypothetical protein
MGAKLLPPAAGTQASLVAMRPLVQLEILALEAKAARLPGLVEPAVRARATQPAWAAAPLLLLRA